VEDVQPKLKEALKALGCEVCASSQDSCDQVIPKHSRIITQQASQWSCLVAQPDFPSTAGYSLNRQARGSPVLLPSLLRAARACAQLSARLVTALREQEALLVINNVTGDNMLLMMKAFFASQPPQQLGVSRVIISSSEEGALQAAGCSPTIHMPGLDRAAAVDLFDATCTLANKNAEFTAGYVALRDRALECVGYKDRGAGVNGQPKVTYIPLVVEATARVLAQCSTLTAASDIVKHLAERGALGALTFDGVHVVEGDGWRL
jgi:hypothetical protein